VRKAGRVAVRVPRHEDRPTHVDVVLELDSDQGSIPCASMLQEGPQPRLGPFSFRTPH